MSSKNYEKLLVKFKEILKNQNLKYTAQREIILKTLYKNKKHFTPEELQDNIKYNYPKLNIGIATIYRTLNILEKFKIVTSISFGQSGKKYELAIKPHHDHLICDICGSIIEFEDKDIEKKQDEIAIKYDFLITSHILQLHGICKKCRKKIKEKKIGIK